MSYNEQETRFFLIDPVLRNKGYNDFQRIKMETPAPVEPTGPKGRRRKGTGRTDYLLCVQTGNMPTALPVGVLEAKKENEDPLKGMQQAKGYADCRRFDVKYVFSTAGAGVKTNLLFFTRGRKTEKIWYYDLSHIKVGKKAPLTLAHFGFAKDGSTLADSDLASNLTAEWNEEEENADKPFPSYARLLPHRGTPKGESRWSWTVDFAARRTKAREEMQPLLDDAAIIKAEVVDLKERLKQLKKVKDAAKSIAATEIEIREKEKAVKELENRVAAIDAAVFDLKAVNPNAVAKIDERTPQQIIDSIELHGKAISESLTRLKTMLAGD